MSSAWCRLWHCYRRCPTMIEVSVNNATGDAAHDCRPYELGDLHPNQKQTMSRMTLQAEILGLDTMRFARLLNSSSLSEGSSACALKLKGEVVESSGFRWLFGVERRFDGFGLQLPRILCVAVLLDAFARTPLEC